MKFRTAALLATTVMLCGCSDQDWDRLLSFGPSGTPSNQAARADASADDAAAPMPVQMADTSSPPPVNAAPQPSYSVTQTVTTVTVNPAVQYCHRVAQGSGAVAARDGMEDAAQQRAMDVTFQACMAEYSGH